MSTTTTRPSIAFVCCAILSVACLATRSDAQQNGAVAAPTSAAYQELASASFSMIKDLKAALPQAKMIIFYEPNFFSVIPYYASTAELLRTAAANMCRARTGPFFLRALSTDLDIGEAAAGLAGLVQLTMPNYATQGQTLSLDNSALIGSFAAVARNSGYVVVNPAYLLPAVSQTNLSCQSIESSQSLSDLWKFVNQEAGKQADDKLDAFQEMRQALTSPEKGAPLLARVLAVESLAHVMANPAEVAVIDMRLDSADIDSTTKSVLWWRKTKFSANIDAHYWIFSVGGQGEQFAIQLVAPGYVNVLRKNVDLARFGAGGKR